MPKARSDLKNNVNTKKNASKGTSSKRLKSRSTKQVLLVITATILVEFVIFYASTNSSWIGSSSRSSLSVTYFESSPKTKRRFRIANVYNETNPLISVEHLSKALDYQTFRPFSPSLVSSLLHDETENPGPIKVSNREVDMSVAKTRQVLASMGANMSDADFDWSQLPPWSQVIDNYHPSNDGSDGDRPILLGLDRCQAYRDAVPPQLRSIGPAGMFSTGTNLLHALMYQNCDPPKGSFKSRKKFDSWQVPWGKHSPEGARLHHAARDYVMWNQSTTLPVVMIRHPYSWMNSMCKHSYSANWKRPKEMCEQTASLHNPVIIRFGANTNRTRHTIKTSYTSIAHLYQEWYLPYFQQITYPAVLARIEDLVFRPKQVVTELCKCVGGNLVPDHKFRYVQNAADGGKGHGKDRSDLLSAFIKFGKSPEEYYSMFSAADKLIMKKVFSRGKELYEAFGYRLMA